jgi:hypothetical protein
MELPILNQAVRPGWAKVTSSCCSPAPKTVREATGPPARFHTIWPALANIARNGTEALFGKDDP